MADLRTEQTFAEIDSGSNMRRNVDPFYDFANPDHSAYFTAPHAVRLLRLDAFSTETEAHDVVIMTDPASGVPQS